MKILVKDNRSNDLIWEEVFYKDLKFYKLDKTQSYNEKSVYAIKDDNRNKIVICSACGKQIPNTPSAIKAHRNMINKANKCFECSFLRPRNEKVVSQKYVLNEDGTYNEATKRVVSLTCGIGWRYYDINSAEARNSCTYARCEHATMKKIEDFWTKYPNAFDEFITIDRIIDTGYKSMHKSYSGITFELKGRGILTANVNNQGICYGFTLYHRRNYYSLRYSKKYDKVFYESAYDLRELSNLDIAESTQDAIIKKLRTLYE